MSFRSCLAYPKALLIACVLLLTAALCLPFLGQARSRPFNDKVTREIEEKRPDYVFIGNSMCESRINPPMFKQLSGKSAYLVFAGPSWIGAWYLWIKNLVATASYRPKKIFVIFVDQQLTQTWFGLPAKDLDQMQAYMSFHEPEFNRIVLFKHRTLLGDIIDRIRSFYGRDEVQEPARQAFASAVMKLSSPAVPVDATRTEINGFLKTAGRRPSTEVLGDQTFKTRDSVERNTDPFNEALPWSFLPPLVELIQKKDLPVCFLRIKRAPLLRHEDDPAFVQYKRDLREYLERNGICYIDESGDPDVTDNVFATPSDDHADHDIYTPIFVRKHILGGGR
jgi:hypothetical protein